MIRWIYRLADLLRARARKRHPNGTLTTGRLGEDLAHRYLESKGFTVVARNYRPRSGHGEIDLVAWDGDILVFVEVKTRSNVEFGLPERNVDRQKRLALRRAAQDYARRAGIPEQKLRYDLVSIVLSHPPSIKHKKGMSAAGSQKWKR